MFSHSQASILCTGAQRARPRNDLEPVGYILAKAAHEAYDSDGACYGHSIERLLNRHRSSHLYDVLKAMSARQLLRPREPFRRHCVMDAMAGAQRLQRGHLVCTSQQCPAHARP